MADKPVRDMRVNYGELAFDESAAHADAIEQFRTWFEDACYSAGHEPNAMTLATVDAQGQPSARTVLLKGYDAQGFVFFTNYQSPKAQDLAVNPRVELCIWWPASQRQVRIRGIAEPIAAQESDEYFATRPRASQIAAHASHQSRTIRDRAELERRFAAVQMEFANREIARPETWGGYRVVPQAIEFWQGRANRMHDRLRYMRTPEGHWQIERLSP